MASPHSFRISPETQSGPTDLFFPIAAIFLNGFSVNVEMFSRDFAVYVRNIILVAEY